MQYQDMTKKEMQREYHRLCQRYQEYEQQGLQLDLSRGKPAPEQLALSQRMLGELNSRSVLDSEDGTDCRNYGGLDGIPEAKALLAGMIGARPEQVMVGGNSSLTMMFDILSHAMLDGLLGAEPWVQVKDRKFLCPVPGYDRHFAMTEHFGFQLIPIPMHNDTMAALLNSLQMGFKTLAIQKRSSEVQLLKQNLITLRKFLKRQRVDLKVPIRNWILL